MDKATFSIFRFHPEDKKPPRFQNYEVPMKPGLTVLDALFYIQGRLDGSIAFRSACRAGVCGSCAMHINGTYRLACETQIKNLGDHVTLRPLGHLPVIRDLLVDMKPFWNKFKYIKPYLIPGNDNPEKERLQSVDDREKLTGVIDCILCAACHGACSITETDKDYLGPAVLTKANRFILDSRDSATKERLKLVGGNNGVWRCHTIFSCQEVCPKDINPTQHIAHLKMLAISKAACWL